MKMKKRNKLQWLAFLLVAALMVTVAMPRTTAWALDNPGELTTDVNLLENEESGGAGGSGGLSAGLWKIKASVSQMQKQVVSGQAPKAVVRVDKAHVPGQQPHIHFKDGTSINQDGTTHDAHKGTPLLSNKIKEWIIKNGWKVNE